MWMPAQMRAHEAQLRALGLGLNPEDLSNERSPVLGAIVSLGGCSASFVSPDGLVITNHHCAVGALQYNSTPADNILEKGFVAKTRDAERSAGPTARVYVTQSITDVTDKVRDKITAIKDDAARYRAIETRSKELIAQCEKDRPGLRCSVPSYYEGKKFFLIEQLEIRDVRVVYAPAEGVGNYGGEIDNWRWPRHSGDVAMYRAYVGPNGTPQDFSKDNVPYKPPHHLKLASSPLQEGDLVFVAGYPGRTSQLKSAKEVEEALKVWYPRRQDLYENYLALLDKLGKADKEVQIKAVPLVRGFGNALTNVRGQQEGLAGGLAQEKRAREADLATFIDADKERKARFGSTLQDLTSALTSTEAARKADFDLRMELLLPRLLSASTMIAKMAEERGKPDAAREPDYQARNWARREQELVAMDKRYHPTLDRELLTLALTRALGRKAEERGAAFNIIAAGAKDEAQIRARVAALYDTTTLGAADVRTALFKNASLKDLQAHKDPLVRLGAALLPAINAATRRDEALSGRLVLLKAAYVEALEQMTQRPIAPDANGTLRLTYGTVRGYRPKVDAPAHPAFTLLPEVAKKHTGTPPFVAPERLLGAIAAGRRGPYVDASLGEVPVNFVADLHITGGNSGSPTLNAKGELCGLVFDGNYEAIASDWRFVPEVTRSIHVDLRYVLYLLDAVDGGGHLLREMGMTPVFDGVSAPR
jgi:hypothetical protein